MRCRFCNCFIYDNKQEVELCDDCDQYLESISDTESKPYHQFTKELRYEPDYYGHEYLVDEY